MTPIVEIHWNAKPHLTRLGVKVGSNALDPRAERLFDEVRESVGDVFPGCVTLVRIAVRRGRPEDEIRLVRHGGASSEGDLRLVRDRIEGVVARAAADLEAAGLSA